MPAAELNSYYGRPVLKAPVWKHHVPGYFFFGGLAGASSVLALAARLGGEERLARRARLTAAGALLPGAVLLVEDLGRPARFLNMLRVVKPTSPMSVGSWLLAGFGPAAAVAAASDVLDVAPAAGRVAEVVAAALGPLVSTYTAVLLADTSVPAWAESHRLLPLVFAASSAASAGAAGVVATATTDARPARRLAVAGAVGATAALEAMVAFGGEPLRPYRGGAAGRLRRSATVLTAAGAAAIAVGRKRRAIAAAGGVAVLGGSLCERLAVFRAGLQSSQAPGARRPAPA